MPYLKNPGGRIVCVDDPKLYEKFLRTPGFSVITKREEDAFINERYQKVAEMQAGTELKQDNYIRGVYFASVTKDEKDGYSVASDKMVKELLNLDLDISRKYKNQKVGVLFHNPYSILMMETPVKVIYTMFESTKIPDDWVSYLEEADKVIVPSRWCRDVFANSGIKADVIPLGFDDDVFTFKERHNRRDKKEVFTFLHYNAFNIRKGFLEVFKAFREEFQPDEPVRMVFKTTLRSLPVPVTKAKYPNIDVINEKYTEKQLVDLLHNSDAFVFPSRGEGFGMTPLEAMATGLPTIVPNAHGISEYFDKDLMYEVKVSGECPGLYLKYKNEDVGKMVICDVADLRKQMRYIYEHQDEAIERGRKASRYVRQWTFRKTASKLKEVIEGLYNTPIENKPTKNVLKLEEI